MEPRFQGEGQVGQYKCSRKFPSFLFDEGFLMEDHSLQNTSFPSLTLFASKLFTFLLRMASGLQPKKQALPAFR